MLAPEQFLSFLCSAFGFAPLFLSILLILGCGGCQQYSSTHATGHPWQVDRTLLQTTNVFNFNYAGFVQGSEAVCKGTATIRPGALPDWVKYYEQASIVLYLTDQSGRILEQHKLEYAPGQNVAQPLEFEFRLDSPLRLDDRSFYISFGYFMQFSEFAPASSFERGEGNGGRKVIRHEAGYK